MACMAMQTAQVTDLSMRIPLTGELLHVYSGHILALGQPIGRNALVVYITEIRSDSVDGNVAPLITVHHNITLI